MQCSFLGFRARRRRLLIWVVPGKTPMSFVVERSTRSSSGTRNRPGRRDRLAVVRHRWICRTLPTVRVLERIDGRARCGPSCSCCSARRSRLRSWDVTTSTTSSATSPTDTGVDGTASTTTDRARRSRAQTAIQWITRCIGRCVISMTAGQAVHHVSTEISTFRRSGNRQPSILDDEMCCLPAAFRGAPPGT